MPAPSKVPTLAWQRTVAIIFHTFLRRHLSLVIHSDVGKLVRRGSTLPERQHSRLELHASGPSRGTQGRRVWNHPTLRRNCRQQLLRWLAS
eukprot:2848696-Amphidinium_carterae.1